MLYTTLHQSRNIQLSLQPTHPVRPVMLTRTCTSRITAYAGTSFTRCFLSFGVVSLSPMAGVYGSIDLIPPRCLLVRAISHSLTKSPHCSLHKESGQCLSSNMAVQNLSAQLSIIGLGCFFFTPTTIKLHVLIQGRKLLLLLVEETTIQKDLGAIFSELIQILPCIFPVLELAQNGSNTDPSGTYLHALYIRTL